ncbi:MAG: Peptidase associated domain protein [Desulfomicrobiaceae bacterium]|nr:Peptidase associated domain protein [Desulfomicrobiaceae bacterium]
MALEAGPDFVFQGDRMTLIPGFTLVYSTFVSEVASHVDLIRHDATGARILSLRNADPNKVFGITFRTPPTDSTGVAHILEHSVLCGSRKYPVKEPFVELLKGSLQTFLNAMTYPDKTCYPVASQNLKDFYNLVDVYLDAVFFARLCPEVFEQEGWHLDLPAPGGELTIKGVVYNEMKGAYSSPESCIMERAQHSIFPDTLYAFDSGGDPAVIPDLTFEAFADFHRRYYHPANSWIFFSGDDDPAARLRLLAPYLDAFAPLAIDSRIPLQPLRPGLVRQVFPFEADGTGRAMVLRSWLIPEDLGFSSMAETRLALRILDQALLGMDASPLRRALVESGLGEDVLGCGMELELAQPYFSVGLKGVAEERLDAVVELVETTLRRLAHEGFAPEVVEAALHSVEFDLRERNTGAYPQGLITMLRALTSWLYDRDPLENVAFEAPLARLKERVAAGEPVFSSLVERGLVANAHGSDVRLVPRSGHGAQLAAEEKERIARLRAACPLSDAELAARTQALRQRQEAPDAPEDLARVPRLTLADVERAVRDVPTRKLAAVPALIHELPTSGVFYLDIALDAAGVPWDLVPYLPLWARLATEAGTSRQDYAAFATRIHRHTGGVVVRPSVFLHEDGHAVLCMLVRAKALASGVPEMLDIVAEALLDARLDDRERFRQILLEEKAALEHALVPAGHRFVATRLRSFYHPAEALQEHMGGIAYLGFVRRLVARLDTDWEEIHAALMRIRHTVVRQGGVTLNLTADGGLLARVEPAVLRLPERFAPGASSAASWPLPQPPRSEAFLVPAQVNHVGKILAVAQAGYRFHGSGLVGCKLLRTGWLWERVRVVGGAYGAFCSLGRQTGLLHFGSYRDPNILSTLEAFGAAATALRSADPASLEQAAIGVSGDLDPCLLPDAQGFAALSRHLSGTTTSLRQQIRDEVLEATPAHIEPLAAAVDRSEGCVCVLGSEDSVNGAKAHGVVFDHVERFA